MSSSMTGDISYGGDLAEAGLLLGGLIIGGAVVGTAIAVGAIGSAVVAGAEKLHDNVVATKDEIRKVQAERDILMKNLKDKAGSVNALNTSGFNAYELSTYKEQEDRLISRLDDIMKRAETATSIPLIILPAFKGKDTSSLECMLGRGKCIAITLIYFIIAFSEILYIQTVIMQSVGQTAFPITETFACIFGVANLIVDSIQSNNTSGSGDAGTKPAA